MVSRAEICLEQLREIWHANGGLTYVSNRREKLLKRFCIALTVAALTCASALAAFAVATPGKTVNEEYAAVTRSFALRAAKAESAAWLAYWKKQEPLKKTTAIPNSPASEISEETDFEVVTVGPCEKGTVAPMFCRQKVSVTYREAFYENGQPTPVEHVFEECTVTDLRVGGQIYAAHKSRRASHFAQPGLRSRFDVPLKGFGFVTVEAPPESGSCGREEIK